MGIMNNIKSILPANVMSLDSVVGRIKSHNK